MNPRISRREFIKMSTTTGLSLLMLSKVPISLASGLSKLKKQTLYDEFDQVAQSLQNQYDYVGLSTGIVTDGKLDHAKGFGVMTYGKSQPINSQSVQPICSMSKAFTGVAIMQLVENGKIDIDHPMVEYVPYFQLADPRYSQIKIRHLLAHNSGLPTLTDTDFYGEWINPQTDDGAIERYVRSLKDMNIILSSYPGDPTNFQYSDMGYDILADVIHKASGEVFEYYCQNHILAPLGMSHSTFLKPEVPPGRLSAAHIHDESGLITFSPYYPYNREHSASSGLFTDVEDMSRWALMHLNGGELHGQRILSTNNHAILWQPLFDLGDGWGYGWGWFSGPYMDHRIYFHGGGQPGVATTIWLEPDTSIGVIGLGNTNTGYDSNYAGDYGFYALTRLLEEI